MKTTAGIIVAVAALLAGIIVFAMVEVGGGGRRAEAACTESAPRCLPKLTLIDTDGEAHPPEALTDKVVIVNVWATWCHPCQAEIPDLTRAWRRYRGKDVALFGLLNDPVDDGALLEFVRRRDMTYPIVRMDGELYESFAHPDQLPTTFIYDRRGRLRFDHTGPIDEGRLREVVDKLLEE